MRAGLPGVMGIVTAATGIVILAVNSLMIAAFEKWNGYLPAVKTADDPAARAVSWVMLIPESFVIPALGLTVLWLTVRFSRRPWRDFVILVAAVTVVWSYGPATHGIDCPSKSILVLTHGVLAAGVIAGSRVVYKKLHRINTGE